jgi:glycosyltransferase involved in cell wall biosynthesis
MLNLVSVIIPAYNAECFISEAILSVFDQSFDNFEIIVVNDGSTDNTLKIISKIQDPRLKIFSQVNSGHSKARNRGILESRGNYITFLDADDLWAKDKLKEQILFLDNHKDYGMVYCLGNAIKSNKILITQISYEGYSGNIFDKIILNARFLHCSSIMIRKEILTLSNGFDETLSHYEDWDLWLRISLLTKIGYINKVLYFQRIHKQGTTVRTFDDDTYLKNLYSIAGRYFSLPDHSAVKKISLKKFLTYAYKMEGFRHLYFSSKLQARKYFIQAIKYSPLKIELYIAFLYTFMNSHITEILHRKIYHKLKLEYFKLKRK